MKSLETEKENHQRNQEFLYTELIINANNFYFKLHEFKFHFNHRKAVRCSQCYAEINNYNELESNLINLLSLR